MAILSPSLFRPSHATLDAAPPAEKVGSSTRGSLATRLNWLRAGVLGANDGIVSVAAIVVGVAGAGGSTPAIIAAGTAGLVGGAISMALGEYVSVSSQSDSQRAMIEKQKRELRDDPAGELDVLAGLYEAHGLEPATARQVAIELTAKDALKAHLSLELNIVEEDVASAWHAAGASALAFTLGAILPLLAILLPPEGLRVPVTFLAVLVALALTGALGARLGGSRLVRATVRVVTGGAAALFVTWLVGTLLGVAVF
ncbi:VIT family protein [Cryobacterium sp. PAMC25264]|uniref:VIT1/CCC1 transporter family protein n=1 Tax=Cryobacterium sp. PAMC25264 TaxID=2861288 RepID=UPI001C62DA1A|nr:VIT family protein [Cryobacterium sp. PAMC25264]QYF72992.1 VIT family protein [Cryobacterium sp. PAMC25264]